MTANFSPIYPLTAQNGLANIANANTTGAVAIFTAGANGARVDALSMSNNDSVAHDVRVYVSDGTTDYLIATIAVPASAGWSSAVGAKAVFQDTNMRGFVVLDPFGNYVCYLKATYILKAAVVVQMPGATLLGCRVLAGDY